MPEEPDQGNAVPHGERLGAGRCGNVRREGGGRGARCGGRRRMDASDVCVVLRVERSSVRSAALSALFSSRGVPCGSEECHMPSMLNLSWAGGPGRGVLGS